MIKVTVKNTLPQSIANFQKAFNLEMPKVMHETMRTLITTTFQFLPPKTKKQGTDAIKKDSKNVFVMGDMFANQFTGIGKEPTQETERIRSYFRNNEFEKLQKIKDAGGLFKNVVFKPFSKNDIHRNNKGRMVKTYPKIISTNPKELQSYLKTLQSHVGRLKGSFGGALSHFGGKAPNWIQSNSDGSFIDNSKDIKAYAEATSNVPYGSSVDSRFNAIKRATDAVANKLEGRIRSKVLNVALQKYYSTPSV